MKKLALIALLEVSKMMLAPPALLGQVQIIDTIEIPEIKIYTENFKNSEAHKIISGTYTSNEMSELLVDSAEKIANCPSFQIIVFEKGFHDSLSVPLGAQPFTDVEKLIVWAYLAEHSSYRLILREDVNGLFVLLGSFGTQKAYWSKIDQCWIPDKQEFWNMHEIYFYKISKSGKAGKDLSTNKR